MTEPATLLRPGLLEGQAVVVLAPGEPGAAAAAACAELGAEVTRVDTVSPDALGGRLDTLVIDSASLFAGAPQEGLAPLRACADAAWEAARAAGTGAMIEAEGGGKIIVIAPGPDAGPHAQGARAALENFARTLSIEWARYDIRVTTIHPGATTDSADVADLVAYLASPAGDYFSGCLFTLA